VEREVYDSAFATIWMDCLGFSSEEEEDWLRQVPYCVDYDEASPWALLIECYDHGRFCCLYYASASSYNPLTVPVAIPAMFCCSAQQPSSVTCTVTLI
jgi:hypothetical protein